MTTPLSVGSSYNGFCPICDNDTTFLVRDKWLRGGLICQSCENGSVPRERALALILNETLPHWRYLEISDCSPVARGVSAKLKREARHYIPTQFYPGRVLGSVHDGFRNEDIGAMTFADESLDLFVSLDVMEHVPDPAAAHREIWRVLRRGGYMLCTWPVRKAQVVAVDPRLTVQEDGSIQHLKEPEYHGNPIDNAGSIVTYDYGYDISKQIAEWAPFDVRVYRFADRTHGILGEYTEVFLAKKV